jgi:hypothetical protein
MPKDIDKTEGERTKANCVRHDTRRPDKTRQDKTRQDKTRQDKTRQDTAKENMSNNTYTPMQISELHETDSNLQTTFYIKGAHPRYLSTLPLAPLPNDTDSTDTEPCASRRCSSASYPHPPNRISAVLASHMATGQHTRLAEKHQNCCSHQRTYFSFSFVIGPRSLQRL